MSATETRTATVYGLTLTHAGCDAGDHDMVEVGGVWYYTLDFGGVIVGSRQARQVDFGGNPHSEWRTAPDSTMGLAATLMHGSLPTRVEYSTPEVYFA